MYASQKHIFYNFAIMKLDLKILLTTIIALSATFFSCKSNKNIVEKAETSTTALPCSEYGISDKDFYRSSASAMSSNISLAKEKAISNAKTLIAIQIIDIAKSAANQYATEMQITDKQFFVKNIEIATNKTIDVALKELAPTCEKYSETNGRYSTFISLEIDKQTIHYELYKQIANTIPDFDKDKFETFFKSSDK